MDRVGRRAFLRTGIVGGAACALARSAWAAPLGANDAVRVAVVGVGGRLAAYGGKGRHHLEMLKAIPGVRIVALCDADEAMLDLTAGELEAENVRVQKFVDIRKLLESKDIDAITIATPNHWHSLMAIWACQAGKDVYVEKPVSHNVWEGRKLVEAALRYGRIVQAGTQSRSDESLLELAAYLRGGALGRIVRARGLCYKRRESIGKVEGPQPIPPRVNYDLWCGPAPLAPLMRKQLHYDWHWVWATGDGDLGNQGVHEMDMCRWMLGEDGLPPRVLSLGGRFGYVDDGETPNTQVTLLDYPKAPILFEVRGLPARSGVNYLDQYQGLRTGFIVECEHGSFVGGAGGGFIRDAAGKRLRQFSSGGAENHMRNFFDAVRSRRATDLKAPIEGGHVSAALCHLANISQRLGHVISREQLRAQLESRADVADAFSRLEAHLEANGVDLAQTNPTLGAALEILPGEERFASHSDYDLGGFANRLARGEYRAPFVVPDKV